MKLRETGDPDVLETRSGGGWISLVGLPFLLGGLAVFIFGVALPQGQGERPPLHVTIPFGAIFVGVGAALIFGRGGIIMDRRGRTIVKWWGLLAPMSRTTYEMAAFHGISLSREIRHSKNGTYMVYAVRIAGEKPIAVDESQDYLHARRAAEALARFLGFALTDSSSGSSVTRQASELDESMRERARRTGEVAELPDQPAGMKTRVEIQSSSVRLETPPAGWDGDSVLMMVMGLLVPGLLVPLFLSHLREVQHKPQTMMIVLLTFVGAFIVASPLVSFLAVLAKVRRREIITVTPDLLQVTLKGLFRGRTVEIPADQLEELTLADAVETPSNLTDLSAVLETAMKNQVGITARSDRTEIRFGERLPQAELEWVYAVVRKMFTL